MQPESAYNRKNEPMDCEIHRLTRFDCLGNRERG